MRKSILLAIFACICFVASYAQNVTTNILSKTIITFAKNKDIPKVEDYGDNLNKSVAILKANPQLKLLVEAYSCGRGSEQHNRDLAQRRANNVRKLFIEKGVNPDQIETASYTPNDPQNSQNDKIPNDCNCVVFRIVKRVEKESAVSNKIPNDLPKAKIFFKRNKDVPIIKDQDDNINKTVAILKANPGLKLIVEGYTSDRGSEQHNRDLAQRRANNVRKLFIEKGVDPSQIETASYTVNDPQNRQNTADHRPKEHDCAIFRIVKR